MVAAGVYKLRAQFHKKKRKLSKMPFFYAWPWTTRAQLILF